MYSDCSKTKTTVYVNANILNCLQSFVMRKHFN